MDADGTKEGYDNELNKAVTSAVRNSSVIASGERESWNTSVTPSCGVGVDAVLAASLFHYGGVYYRPGEGVSGPGGHPRSDGRVRDGMVFALQGDLSKLEIRRQRTHPAVIQDWQDNQVLMVAYMNRESLEKTLATGQTWFYSRSRRVVVA